MEIGSVRAMNLITAKWSHFSHVGVSEGRLPEGRFTINNQFARFFLIAILTMFFSSDFCFPN